MLAAHEALMHNPDKQLVERCRSGDMDAFSSIYARYERQIFRYAYHMLGHREDADDIKQETFVRAYQNIGSFRADAGLQTWLLKICGNLCRDRIKSWEKRKVQYHAEYQEELSGKAQAQDPYRIVERAQTVEMVMCALQDLPVGQREIIVLRDLEEREYVEIGEILGCSAISAKLRVFRARKALQVRVKSLLY